VEQHEREQAGDLLMVGLGRQLASEPDRLASEVTRSTVATSPGWLNRTPETVRLALLIRWAMVASGTR
jgi:hypothetical protein